MRWMNEYRRRELVRDIASLLQKMWRGWDGGKPFYPPTHV